jgi:hypothetical protein
MIQHVLFLAIIGLAVAHLYKSWTEVEGFDSVDGLLNGLLDAQTADITSATGKDIFNRPSDRIANVSYKTAGNHGDPPMAPDHDDPRDLPWIASWTPADRAARQGHTCIPKHEGIGVAETTIITTSHSCEGGMPHTRPGDRIIIPDSTLPTDRQDIINHELIHIFQARNADAWKRFYRQNWSFEVFREPPGSLPEGLRAAKRSNPDTWNPAAGGAWSCWKGRWWPLAVYTDPQHPKLREAKTVWWDTWKQTVLGDSPEGWSDFFGVVSQDEHPHEMAAVYIATEDQRSEAGRRLHQWWISQGQVLFHSLKR